MNKAVTDGIDFMPPPFADGLEDWSAGDGTPGSTTYATDPTGNLVTGDPDFGTCLELQKIVSTQALRYMGEVPVLPGCYLEVTARVKAISGPLPQVRIAGYAGGTGGQAITPLTDNAPAVQLTEYGRVETVSAIIALGDRPGVNMVFASGTVYGHLGIDISGDIGSLVRVESIKVQDRTVYFHRDLMDWVDVRDYGAVGDGVTDDAAAFEAADAVADGRDILVSAGSYFLNKNITLVNRVRFEGTVVQPSEYSFILRAFFDFNAYIDAFGDETTALKKALHALFNFSDHESLDLNGRRIQLDAPIDVAAAVSNITNFGNRRAIRNGQFSANDTAAWTPDVVTSNAGYSPSASHTLTGVTNIAAIAVGSLVEGFGVGREVYVTAKDDGAGEITLSQPLYGAASNQSYTFTRFKYMLDFSGFVSINRFQIEDIEFLGNRRGAGIMLPPAGIAWSIRDCWFARPAHRSITSIGDGCNGISIDGNQFLAFDDDETVANRTSVCFNTNKNDIKVRNNRAVDFLHFGVMAGGGHIITGNHFWQDDGVAGGDRSAGLVLCQPNAKTTITANYVDNYSIDLTNEYDPYPDPFPGKGPFGTLTITGNIFTGKDVPSWFTFIRLLPIGTGHPIDGISVIGNAFKPFGGPTMDRVDSVDTSRGSIDHSQSKGIEFHSNSFRDVVHRTESPATVQIEQTSRAQNWDLSLADKLPFGGRALGAEGLTALGPIENASSTVTAMPYVDLERGALGQDIRVRWPESVSGKVQLKIRSDLPS